MPEIPVVTTDSLPGYEVTQILGNGPIIGSGPGPDVDLAYADALRQLRIMAARLGAQAVVGVGMSHRGRESVTLCGTAVRLETTGPRDVGMGGPADC